MIHLVRWSRVRRGPTLACAGALSLFTACAEVPLESGAVDDAGLGEQSLLLARSTNPPAGLTPSQVPQFVAITFDDNFQVDGMDWATNLFTGLVNPPGSGNAATFDGQPVRASFYHNCTYIDHMRAAWQRAVDAGHETGDHTQNHREGLAFTSADWIAEIDGCRSTLTSALGLTAQKVSGFRAPFLMYNDALYSVLETRTPPFAYDTSIPSCLGASEDGTNCAWPYTLDVPSVDAANRHALDPRYPGLAAHAGFWEIPVPVVVVPPAMRARVSPSAFDGGPASGKILGMDINMFYNAQLDRETALATLKNTLDLHLAGNRAPLVFVAHTHVYDASWEVHGTPARLSDRRAVLADFIAYALTKPAVRMRSVSDILGWLKSPVPLGSCTPSCSGKACGSDGCGGSCGSCAGSASCQAGQCVACVPSCTGKVCGDDGCGGTCGTCGAGQSCQAGQCASGPCGSPAWASGASYAAGATVTSSCQVSITECAGKVGQTLAFRCDLPAWCSSLRPGSGDGGWWSAWKGVADCQGGCVPSCAGKTCGPDGCGGSCGTCGANQACSGQGQCVTSCVPSCSGKTCGSDGCGGSCGTCGANQACSAQGQCVASCVPSCAGKTCGPDGCGGSCGTCGANQACSAQGQCVTGQGCSAPLFASGTSYAAGALVRATCTSSIAGTACYQQVGKTFTFRCDNPAWCSLAPGSDQSGWWAAWSMQSACP